MKILKVLGTTSDEQRTVLDEFVSIWERGQSYAELLKRLPSGRIEVHVGSDADDHPLGVIFIDHHVVSFLPLDDSGTTKVH